MPLEAPAASFGTHQRLSACSRTRVRQFRLYDSAASPWSRQPFHFDWGGLIVQVGEALGEVTAVRRAA